MVSLYNNGGGGYGPSNNGKRAYTLDSGVVPISREQEAQRGIPRPYLQNKLPARHLMKLLVMEALLLFKKNSKRGSAQARH